MSSETAETRERSVLDFLDDLPRDLGGVLIGGYAVSAYGQPRFSVDVDLVFPVDSEPRVRRWLGTKKIPSKETLSLKTPTLRLSKVRVSHAPFSGDLYFGAVRAREHGATVPYRWIRRGAREMRLALLAGRTRAAVSVARPEALWALKLLAGRLQDVSDLFALSRVPFDPEDVRHELTRFTDSPVQSALRRTASRIARGDDFADALSRQSLGSPRDERNRAAWSAFQALAARALPEARRPPLS